MFLGKIEAVFCYYITMGDAEYSARRPWLFDLRSSKQLIGLAVFATTFTDGFLYGIVSFHGDPKKVH